MRAVAVTQSLPIDQPTALVDIELPRPTPGPRDLLVAVRAVSVNPVDTKVRASVGKLAQPRVLGWDAAGVVEAVGGEVTLFEPGDEVYYAGDITRPGSNQELQLVDERIVGKKPSTLDFAQAAALPLTAITAYEALFERLDLDVDKQQHAGKSLLVIAGAGGVGSIAIQLARLAGLQVIATASREESLAWVTELGAQHAIDHHKDLASELKRIGVGEVDAVAIFYDTGRYFPALPALLKPQGRSVGIVETKTPVDLTLLMGKSLSFAWESMFTRSRFQTPDMIEQHRLLNRVAEWVDAGQLRTTLQIRKQRIDAANLRQAHAVLESGRSIGKIVLEGWS